MWFPKVTLDCKMRDGLKMGMRHNPEVHISPWEYGNPNSVMQICREFQTSDIIVEICTWSRVKFINEQQWCRWWRQWWRCESAASVAAVAGRSATGRMSSLIGGANMQAASKIKGAVHMHQSVPAHQFQLCNQCNFNFSSLTFDVLFHACVAKLWRWCLHPHH